MPENACLLQVFMRSPLSISIADRQSLPSDDRDQDAARFDWAVDDLDKVEAELQTINFHEHVITAKVLPQAVMQATGRHTALPASVADEAACHLLGRICKAQP